MGESSSIGNGITAQLTLPAGTYENRFFIVLEDVPEEDPRRSWASRYAYGS